MNINKVKMVAGELLKVGSSKIWIDPEQVKDVAGAMTKDDLRELIAKGAVGKRDDHSHSRGRARVLLIKKRKGRKGGHGKRRGTSGTRTNAKENWMKRVRAQRELLSKMKKEGKVENYSELYSKVKGNLYKGKKQLEEAIKEGKKQK